jgi:O-antigen/teichoic acid export membrane protein
MSSGNKKLLIKGAAWMGSSRLLVNAIGLVSTMMLARMLVPEDFGLVAIAESVFALVAAITELSLAHSLIQLRKPRAHHYDTAWTLNVLRALLLAIVMVGLGFPIAQLYGDDRLIDLFFVLGAATFIGGFENPKLALFTRDLIFWQEFALRVASKLVGFIVAIAIAYTYQSYWALVLGSLAAQITVVIVSYIVHPYRPRISLRGYRDLLSFSVWLTLSYGIQTANWRLDPVMLGLFVPSGTVGQFAVGNRLAYLPVKEGLGPILTLFFPAFSRMQGDMPRLRYAYLNGQGMVCLLAMPVAAGFAILAAPLVELALGAKWLPAVPVIQVFAVLSALHVIENSQPLAMALGRTKDVFRRDLRVFLIRVPIVLFGLFAGAGSEFGALLGIVAGRAVSGLINIGLNMRLVTILSGIPAAQQMAVALRPVLAASMMGAILLMLGNKLDLFSVSGSSPQHIGLMIVLGALIYPLLLLGLWLIAGRPAGAERGYLDLLQRGWQTARAHRGRLSGSRGG